MAVALPPAPDRPDPTVTGTLARLPTAAWRAEAYLPPPNTVATRPGDSALCLPGFLVALIVERHLLADCTRLAPNARNPPRVLLDELVPRRVLSGPAARLIRFCGSAQDRRGIAVPAIRGRRPNGARPQCSRGAGCSAPRLVARFLRNGGTGAIRTRLSNGWVAARRSARVVYRLATKA